MDYSPKKGSKKNKYLLNQHPYNHLDKYSYFVNQTKLLFS